MSKSKVRGLVAMKRCRYCLATEELTVDHKIPLSKGGSNKPANLQCLCRRCNSMKASLTQNDVRRLFEWHTNVVFERAIHTRERKREQRLKKLNEENAPKGT